MSRFLKALVLALGMAGALAPLPGRAAGSIPVALSQQVDSNGRPLVGCLLYLYVVGTVAQPQLAYNDTALTQPVQWPVVCDANGRLPMFYLADGSIHVRLTDASGSVQFDYPSMLVIGPSGGGGGGAGVDPTTIASTGDVKFRPTSETLSGWVKLNGQTVGSSTSGASGRANADTQALFVYLWTNCAQPSSNARCVVPGGLGGSALADFNANKQITLPDWRGRVAVGLDDMGTSAAGRFTGVPFFGSDTATTPFGGGGENTHTLTLAEAPPGQFTLNFSDPGHSHGITQYVTNSMAVGGGPVAAVNGFGGSTAPSGTGISVSIADHAGGGAHNEMQQFQLGTWFMRL